MELAAKHEIITAGGLFFNIRIRAKSLIRYEPYSEVEKVCLHEDGDALILSQFSALMLSCSYLTIS